MSHQTRKEKRAARRAKLEARAALRRDPNRDAIKAERKAEKRKSRHALVRKEGKAAAARWKLLTPEQKQAQVAGKDFLWSPEWRMLRHDVIQRFGKRCMCCGEIPRNPWDVHVDHIKPRKYYPHLALEESNLQILCAACNGQKSNSHSTDYRAQEEARRAEEAKRLEVLQNPLAFADAPECGSCGEGVMVRWAGGAALRCTACKRVEWLAANDAAERATA